jgi:type III restriction enzyme
MTGQMPTYRNIWRLSGMTYLKKGRTNEDNNRLGEPILPKELQGALHSLYGNYEKYYRQWEANTEGRANDSHLRYLL